jgi:hypothetical protein
MPDAFSKKGHAKSALFGLLRSVRGRTDLRFFSLDVTVSGQAAKNL